MHSIKVSHTHSFNPSQLRLLTFTKISVISIREWVETRRNRSFHYEGMNNSRILASNKNQCTPGLENLPSQNCWESLWDIQVSMLHCRISIMGIECVPLFWRLATERRNKGESNCRRRWHGTIRACRLGDDSNEYTLCNLTECSLCHIIRVC